MGDMVAKRAAELRIRVGEHLHPGEACLAGTWVTHVVARLTTGEITRAALGGKALGEEIALEALGFDQAATGPDTHHPDRRGIVHGGTGALAVDLDEHIPEAGPPRALALTTGRLLLLAKIEPAVGARAPRSLAHSVLNGARDFIRNQPAANPIPPLKLLWQCRRDDLASATAGDGRLRLAFADRSSLILRTPDLLGQAFAYAQAAKPSSATTPKWSDK